MSPTGMAEVCLCDVSFKAAETKAASLGERLVENAMRFAKEVRCCLYLRGSLVCGGS